MTYSTHSKVHTGTDTGIWDTEISIDIKHVKKKLIELMCLPLFIIYFSVAVSGWRKSSASRNVPQNTVEIRAFSLPFELCR
jgi:hypothetical protein